MAGEPLRAVALLEANASAVLHSHGPNGTRSFGDVDLKYPSFACSSVDVDENSQLARVALATASGQVQAQKKHSAHFVKNYYGELAQTRDGGARRSLELLGGHELARHRVCGRCVLFRGICADPRRPIPVGAIV